MENGFDLLELQDFLNAKYLEYNTQNFIYDDPIQIPHLFSKKEDVEISGFLTSIISWGRRSSIIKSAKQMMSILDSSPFEFISQCTEKDINRLEFTYRTFNSVDFRFFLRSLKNIYQNYNGLENTFLTKKKE